MPIIYNEEWLQKLYIEIVEKLNKLTNKEIVRMNDNLQEMIDKKYENN